MKRIAVYHILLLVLPVLLMSPVIAQPQTPAPNKVDSIGRKQGFWRKFANDTIKYEGTFRDDYPIGEFKYFYFNKNVKSVVQYSEKGIRAVTVNYYEDGNKMGEGEYWAKKKHGLWKYYSKVGYVIAVEDYHYGVPAGEWITYYEDGKPNEIIHYNNGLKDGAWLQYYPDSIAKLKGNYAGGKLSGLIFYYGLNGSVVISGNYKEDMKDGLWMYFDDAGKAEKRITYSRGNTIKEEISLRGPDKQSLYLNTEDIAYIFNNNGAVTVRMKDSTDHITERKMDDFRKILNEFRFFRVNAKYIVSVWSVSNRKIYSSSDRVLILKPRTADKVIVAEDVAESFLQWAGLVKGEVDPKNTPQE